MLKQLCCLLPVNRLTHGTTLLGILTATLMLLIHSSSAQDTFSGMQESYAVYPGWRGLGMQEGLLQLTFTTSTASGLLVYAVGDQGMGPEALAVMLERGRVFVKVQRYQVRFFSGQPFLTEIIDVEQFYVSETLNDNTPHTLSLQRSPGQFTVSVLDRMSSESSSLLARSSNIGSTEVYIGGLPTNRTSLFPTSGSFIGCLEDIQYSNDSTNTSSLVDVTPLEQKGVMEGCLSAADLCANVSCGAGTCMAVLPESYYCDCSSTPLGGASCDEDLSLHRLNLTVDSYLCYDIDNFPFIKNAASVRLLAPLPHSGTIMTGFSSNKNHLKLYIEESILNLEFVSNNTIVKLSVSQALHRSTSYQVNVDIGEDNVVLVLATVSGDNVTEIDRLIDSRTLPVSTLFSTVCVGGTMLDLPYYAGILERVIYNSVPLSDRNFVQQATVETPVNLVSFSRDFATPTLTFKRFTFANFQRISFEIRFEQDNTLFGTPLSSRNSDVEFQFNTVNGEFVILGDNLLHISCTRAPEENVWHRIDLNFTRNDNGTADLLATVDNTPCNPLTDEQRVKLGELLSSLSNSSAPLDFAASKIDDDKVTALARFIGCLRNIEFRATPDGDPVRPDFSSAIRAGERFGSGEECYSCNQLNVDCQNGEVCADCGFFYQAHCVTDAIRDCPALTSPTSPPRTTSTSLSETTVSLSINDSTSSISTTNDPTRRPSTPGSSLNSTLIGMYVGIALGGVLAIVILVIIAVLLLLLCVRVRAGGQGFYKTEETNGKPVTMLHYSVSLRQIASEQVTVAETNGVSHMHGGGVRPKEFYM